MINISIIILLVLLSGLFSGLTLGLLGLSKSELETKMKAGATDTIKKQAKKVYSVRKNGNMLLCTLLLGNVAVNAALTQFLGQYGDGVVVILAATALITLFGEILPQALVSKHALNIGSRFVIVVKIFQVALYPIVWLIAKGLDKLLGKELRSYFSKEEFIEEIKDHEDSRESEIDADEEKILLGALTYSNKTVNQIMTPKPVSYMLQKDTEITTELIKDILDKGFTRIPVYDENMDDIKGVLLVKRLLQLLIDGGCKGTVADFTSSKYSTVKLSTKLDEMLNIFDENNHHIALVTDEFGTIVGLITMEDIIEAIINREIMDESDTVEDMRSSFKKKEKTQ